jgi:YHS domain-containing protein
MSKFLLVCALGIGLTTAQAFAADKPAASSAATTTPKMEVKKEKMEHPANVFFKNKAGMHFVDPVSGMRDVVTDKSVLETVDGKEYYFSSADDAAKFKADSKTFTSKLVLPARVVSVEGADVMAADPVSGQHVKAADPTIFRDHKGRRFYFESEANAKVFDTDPAKALAAHSMKMEKKAEMKAQKKQAEKKTASKPMETN